MLLPRSVLITGASSGIGRALALAYAKPGVHLALSGRNEKRLKSIVQACADAGSSVNCEILDVTNKDDMRTWVTDVDNNEPLDLVIANAGVSGGTGGSGETENQTRMIFETNINGIFNTVFPAADLMRARKNGQIALVSSLASFRGFVGAPAYSASKAAVRTYGEALRGLLQGDGIGVSVICPGFVESRMTAGNKYKMPFLMTAERAAAIIQRGVAHNKARIAFPFPIYFLSWFLGSLPPGLTDPLFRILPKKNSVTGI
ncbi:MAG: short-chain dehydrogenase [Rhodospirillaceae bacterium]|nr:short-chain dehydrogenase [Rhodospirillaceae bacterium]